MSLVLPKIATLAVSVGAGLLVARQCRKPWSWPGRLFISLMNQTHAGLTHWGLGHVTVTPDAIVLDVGCGGGLALRRLAQLARRAYGVDYSATSAAAATRANADLIAAGRVTVQQASISELPFPDATFDVVTAFETHYYWPNPVQDFQEALRVLKPGGVLVVVAEAYKRPGWGALLIVPMFLLRARYLTLDQHRELFRAAGFADIDIQHDPRRGWLCAIGRRPQDNR